MNNIENHDRARWEAIAAKACQRIETRLFINGEYVDAVQGGRFETIDPSNGEVLAAMSAGTSDDIDRAVAAARRAYRSGVWSKLAPRERMEILYRFADLIDQQSGHARDQCMASIKSYTQSKSAWIRLASD